jgi:predicted transcriptional regulator
MVRRAHGELESQILYLLRSGKRLTVKDVHRLLGEVDNYNTIMTVMSRLAVKGQLAREKAGLQYEYWLVAPASAQSLIEKVKQKFFGLKTSTLVTHLIESADDLSEEDLEEMERLVREAKEKRGKK